jgi:hypothetical protein
MESSKKNAFGHVASVEGKLVAKIEGSALWAQQVVRARCRQDGSSEKMVARGKILVSTSEGCD